jgi:hypothetical protein
MNEFRWTKTEPLQGAMDIPYSYHIPLSRRYSEYDLLPLTPDNERGQFVYRGLDGDHFNIYTSGTVVSKISIWADTYDFNSQQSVQVKSSELQIVENGVRAYWDQPLGVADRRLLDQFSLVTYKAVISLHYESYLEKLQGHHLATVKSER